MATTAPTRFCSASQTCPNRTNGGPCREHANEKEHQRFNYAWRRLYRQRRWKALRLEIMFGSPFCSDCDAKGQITPTEEIHHKRRPTTEDEFFDRENLQGLCKPCHSERTARGE